ncbi:MAG: LysR family transcriptional regulator [Xanthobacteraceae bacterium]
MSSQGCGDLKSPNWAAFAAIADHGSFVKAAGTLAASTSKLSKMIRTLEERLGVRLLNRTTRSVALTAAGEHFLGQVRPALDDLGSAVESISAFRDTPAGTLGLTVSSVAAATDPSSAASPPPIRQSRSISLSRTVRATSGATSASKKT